LTYYPKPLISEAASAARRSHREADEGKLWTAPLAECAAAADASQQRLEGSSRAAVSGEVSIAVDNNMRIERTALQNNLRDCRTRHRRVKPRRRRANDPAPEPVRPDDATIYP